MCSDLLIWFAIVEFAVDQPPLVSVVVACKNVAPFIGHCLQSALCQTVSDLEVIVVDDGSTDGTVGIVQSFIVNDPRIRLFMGSGTGPAAARNIGLRQSRGAWVSILDGDDLFHPERLGRLLEMAATSNADIVADGLIAFNETQTSRVTWPFFPLGSVAPSQTIDIERLFRRTSDGLESPLGYMKPVIRRAFLLEKVMAYSDNLFIGEDFDFLARLLANGARMIATPLPLYFYRRHSASISHRLSAKDAADMLSVAREFAIEFGAHLAPEDRKLVSDRIRRLTVQKYTQDLIFALKAKSPIKTVRAIYKCPAAVLRTLYFVGEGLHRRLLQRRQKTSPLQVSSVLLMGGESQKILDLCKETNEAVTEACNLFAASLGKSDIAMTIRSDPYWSGFMYPFATSRL